MQGKKIYLHYRQSNVRTLGPGDRYVIWTQGCPHSCPNCIAPDTHPLNKNGYYIFVDILYKEILENVKANNLRGITISGGEPFLQAEGLLELVSSLKKEEENLDFIVFTGYEYLELLSKNDKYINGLLENIDILIDGKYVSELNENNYLRGSSNQNIIHLSDKYKIYSQKMLELKSRNIETFIVDKKRIFIAGIPMVNYVKKEADK